MGVGRLRLIDSILLVFSFFFHCPWQEVTRGLFNKSDGLKETYPSRSFNSRPDDVSVQRGCRHGGLMECRSHSAGIDDGPVWFHPSLDLRTFALKDVAVVGVGVTLRVSRLPPDRLLSLLARQLQGIFSKPNIFCYAGLNARQDSILWLILSVVYRCIRRVSDFTDGGFELHGNVGELEKDLDESSKTCTRLSSWLIFWLSLQTRMKASIKSIICPVTVVTVNLQTASVALSRKEEVDGCDKHNGSDYDQQRKSSDTLFSSELSHHHLKTLPTVMFWCNTFCFSRLRLAGLTAVLCHPSAWNTTPGMCSGGAAERDCQDPSAFPSLPPGGDLAGKWLDKTPRRWTAQFLQKVLSFILVWLPVLIRTVGEAQILPHIRKGFQISSSAAARHFSQVLVEFELTP